MIEMGVKVPAYHWQPIESCPLDTNVVVWCTYFGIPREGMFKDGHWWSGGLVRRPSALPSSPTTAKTFSHWMPAVKFEPPVSREAAP